MNCDMDHIPTFGLMGLMLHRMMNRARSMYQEFDLNRSQASVLFFPASEEVYVPEGAGCTVEYDTAVHYFYDSEDGAQRIYFKKAGSV